MIELNITFVILVANFLLLMFILNKKLFKPMIDHLEKRDYEIKGSFKNAKEMEDRSEEKMQEYKLKIQESRKNILAEQNILRDQALEQQKQVLKSTRQTGEAKISQTKNEVNQQLEAVRGEFSKIASAIASEISSVILVRKDKKN